MELVARIDNTVLLIIVLPIYVFSPDKAIVRLAVVFVVIINDALPLIGPDMRPLLVPLICADPKRVIALVTPNPFVKAAPNFNTEPALSHSLPTPRAFA
jgi:hypothetical protein